MFVSLRRVVNQWLKPARTSNQTVVAKIKPLNPPTALYNTVRNAMRFKKLRYLSVFA